MNTDRIACIVESKEGHVQESLFRSWIELLKAVPLHGPIFFAGPDADKQDAFPDDVHVWPSSRNSFRHLKQIAEQFRFDHLVRIQSRIENVTPEFVEEVLRSHDCGRAECTYATMAELNVPGVLIEVLRPEAVEKLDHHSPGSLYGGRIASIGGVKAQQHRPSVSMWRRYCGSRFPDFFDFPVLFNLEASKTCVCHCRMCLSHGGSRYAYNRTYPPLMKWPLFQRIVDGIAGRAFRAPTIINLFLAGEALLNKNLEKMTEYCRERGMLVFISTNAVLLDAERSLGLLRAGIHGLYCSVDGARKETFEGIRVGAEYEKVVQNIHRFIELKNEMGLDHVQVGMKFVLQDANRQEVDEYLKYWMPRVHNVAFQSMVVRDDPSQSGGRVMQTYYQDDSRRRPCCAPFMGMSVAADGKVLPCVLTNFQKEEEIMGDLAVQSIEEVWHSEKYETMRELHLKEEWDELPMCGSCDGVLGDNAEIEVLYQDDGLIKIVTPGAITFKHQ